MPIYHFVIESDWFLKKGFIESSSTWKAKEQIELKTSLGENGKIIKCEKGLPLNECINELNLNGFVLYENFNKMSVDDICFDTDEIPYEDLEGLRFMY